MSEKAKADILALIHLAWVILALASLPLVLYFEGYRSIALAYVVVTASSWFLWKGCPLRIWEQTLRQQGDPDGAYDEGFIAHYLKRYFSVHVPHSIVRVIIVGYLGLLFIVSVR